MTTSNPTPTHQSAQAEPREAWTRAMNAALTYRNVDPEAMDEQDAWVALVKAISALAAPLAAPEPVLASEHHGLDTAERVCFYEQDFYVLSNFSSFNLLRHGYYWPTSEHAYHAEKFRNHRGDIAKLIATAPSAHEAFKIAERHKAERIPEWDEVKVGIMREILQAKADQHDYVRRKLLATGERELVENSWRDDYWGWGPSRDGTNMLGKLWMEVRSELRAVQAEAARVAEARKL